MKYLKLWKYALCPFYVSFAPYIIMSLIITNIANADCLFSLTSKYGPNGYVASGSNSVSSSSISSGTCAHCSSSSSNSTTNNLSISNRYEVTPGLRLQTIPDSVGGLSMGMGYYFDNTVEASVGIRF
jgi:hypothetical protein